MKEGEVFISLRCIFSTYMTVKLAESVYYLALGKFPTDVQVVKFESLSMYKVPRY